MDTMSQSRSARIIHKVEDLSPSEHATGSVVLFCLTRYIIFYPVRAAYHAARRGTSRTFYTPKLN